MRSRPVRDAIGLLEAIERHLWGAVNSIRLETTAYVEHATDSRCESPLGI
jgi:hypothetical protein